MTIGERVRMIGGELLRKVVEPMGYAIMWPGRRHEISHPDYTQLGRAYEEKPFVAQACDLSAAFLFAGGFKFRIGDGGRGTGDGGAEAAQALAAFFARHEQTLWQAAVDSALYRTAYLVFEYDEETEQVVMRAETPEGIRALPRKLAPWKTDGYKIRVELEDGVFEQTLTQKESVVKSPGVAAQRTVNPYGLIPVVQVAEKKRSGKTSGRGLITDQVYDLCDMYGELRAAGYEGESYHGNPVPWVKGLKDSAVMRAAIEAGDWGPGQMIEMTEKGEAGFLETTRGCEGVREQMKMVYYGLICETGIPEYVWGVHMQSAQASTGEQKDAIERHAAGRRMWWGPALVEAAKVALTMMEYHGELTGDAETRRRGDAEISIEWGPVIEGDKKAAAEATQAQVTAVEAAVQSELLSRKSAIGKTGLVVDPEAEQKLIEGEKAERLKDEGGRMNPEQETQGTPGTEETGAEG